MLAFIILIGYSNSLTNDGDYFPNEIFGNERV